MSRLAILVLLAGMAAAQEEGAPPNFAQPGPCTTSTSTAKFAVPSEQRRGGLPKELSALLTIPSCQGAASAFGNPAPLLVLYNGFQSRASWYARLAAAAGSWGWAVAQYDLPRFPLVDVRPEVELFPALLKWVGDQAADPASPLHQAVDAERVAVAGHSRGGKLASLVFTSYPDLVQAAYLVDPVDVTQYSPESPENPSAARALAASGQAVGIVGAGIVSSCNPAGGNYETLYAVAGNGSWLGVLPEASHSQFQDAGCLGNAAADLLCGRGKDSRAQVAGLTATQMLAWLWQQLVGAQQEVPASQSPLPGFYAWVEAQQAQGLLDFEVKEVPASEWEGQAAAQAPPAPAYPTGAEEEALCAVGASA